MQKQKRARGRPKKNWMEGVRKVMNGRNLNEGQWEDRKRWSLTYIRRICCDGTFDVVIRLQAVTPRNYGSIPGNL